MMAQAPNLVEHPSIPVPVRGSAAGGENDPPTPNVRRSEPEPRAALLPISVKDQLTNLLNSMPLSCTDRASEKMLLDANLLILNQPVIERKALFAHLKNLLSRRTQAAHAERDEKRMNETTLLAALKIELARGQQQVAALQVPTKV